MVTFISASASCLNSSNCTGFNTGRLSIEFTPKLRKNSSVVPKRSGRPGASNLPNSQIRLYSTNLLTAWSEDTPRIFSISAFVFFFFLGDFLHLEFEVSVLSTVVNLVHHIAVHCLPPVLPPFLPAGSTLL